MRPFRIALFVLAFGAFTACTPPATTGSASTRTTNNYVPPEGATEYGPGDYCADTYVIVQETTRANFSLGSEYFRSGDYCAAYPYVKHLLATEPLFTGEDPDDRNYQRMALIYEQFAAQVDSTNRAEKLAYLDSSRMARQQGIDAMKAQGIVYDAYARDLYEGFFYFQNAGLYDDAQQRQFDAFSRAFESAPDSLDDWYLNQLYIGSAEEFGDEPPNPQRAAFLRKLAAAADNDALKESYVQYADYIETEPSASFNVADGGDAEVQALLDALDAGTLTGQQRVFTLYATADQQPERIEALGKDPDDVISRLVRLPEIVDNVNSPTTLYALSVRARREGDSGRANELFQRAIENAASNAQRADFYYSAGQYDRALQVFPQHGPSLYRRAGQIADAVGRPTSLKGRFAYWCLADNYRNVAAATSGSVRDAARRAAAGYERAGPTREQYFLEGYRPGQSVTASQGAYGSCTTRVR